MAILKNLTNKIINFIKKYHSTDDDISEVLQYGIYITILNIFDLILIFAISIIFNIFKYVLISFISFNVLRSLAGGVHAKTPLTCLLASSAILLGIPCLILNIPLFSAFKYVCFFISLLLIFLYAPADVSEKPITNKSHRKILKILSISYVLVLTITSVFTSNIIGSIMSLCAFSEAISISPIIYKITKSKYGYEIDIDQD